MKNEDEWMLAAERSESNGKIVYAIGDMKLKLKLKIEH